MSKLSVMDAGEDSLDLIIPSKADFLVFTKTLDDLLAFYQEEAPGVDPDHAWIEHHLADMGRSCGPGEDGPAPSSARGAGGVSCADWVALCRRWDAPVSRAEAAAMYRAFREGLASERPGEGLDVRETARLLEVLRRRGLDMVKTGADDPLRRLFRKLAGAGAEDGGREGAGAVAGPALSAAAFLRFVHERQKETDWTLGDVQDLFGRLNGHRVTPQLEDAISVTSGASAPTEGEAVSCEREYISWEAFGRYLLLESNDVFNPERTQPMSRQVGVLLRD